MAVAAGPMVPHTTAIQGDTLRSIGAVLAVGLVGALAVVFPLAILPVLGALYLFLRGKCAFRDAMALMLAGNMALSYGFANIGFRGLLPVPFSDALLMLLVAWTLVYQKSLRGIGSPAIFMTAIICLACIRLATDFYTYGTPAIRDFTTPLETTFVLVGYWSFREFGLKWALRLWTGVAIAVVFYGLFFPFIGDGTGPQVGLQQPVYLFAQYVGIGPAIVSAMFLFMLRLKSPWCWLTGAVCLAELAVMQMKGLYLAVPFVVLLLGLAAGRIKTHLPQRLGAALLFGGILLVVAVPFIPSGRVGKVSLNTFIEQFAGLDGDKNKAGGEAVSDRLEWQTRAWKQQKTHVGDMVWGMGLGRDLAGGFNSGGEADVRKPHNDYIEILARYGFIGLGLWLAFIGSLLVPVWRAVKSSLITPDERSFLLWVLATSVTALFIAATQPLLAYPYGTAAIFCTLGMGLALARDLASRRQRELEAERMIIELPPLRSA